MDGHKLNARAAYILNKALEQCQKYRHEYVMPEHLLSALLNDEDFRTTLAHFDEVEHLDSRLHDFFDKMSTLPPGAELSYDISHQMSDVIKEAVQIAKMSGREWVTVPHLISAMFQLKESWAAYLLKEHIGGNETEFLRLLISYFEEEQDSYTDDNDDATSGDDAIAEASAPAWRKWTTCINDLYALHNPLIGREKELERTIQVLCRLDKNNPLHVGEPGVGKTSLVWGLAQLIEEKKVPRRLQGSRIYQIDLGTLLAGAQFRGDFEGRIKMIMDGIAHEGDNNIVYIDEIHTLIGAGAGHDNALDASNLLKPYLETGKIRFIGSTTYEEYNRYFARSKGMIRRFQQIDIEEPSIEETIHILFQLRRRYEEFHNIEYTDDAIEYAVKASAKHIAGRFLPDKAIDLIDEAGAAMQISNHKSRIGRKEIADVLAKTCKVKALSEADADDYQQLSTLAPRMHSQIFGQDEAIKQVVEAVQLSRAGLLDDRKPMATLLFVGPTGVGKTEVAKVLAKELGVELVRFDMSEYMEKHTVAKLIGSPAGYVGYEDGGLLTDAVRKSPNCVLLLDEIEKAHNDIYNILLQVMDYATLTDNKGNRADFRNVIVIMTSNAGAQYASQGSMGFIGTMGRGDTMMKQVKRIFNPEFLNRLTASVVFRDMDRPMAKLILKKKLTELKSKLQSKAVSMTLTHKAFDYLLAEGFSPEYGAREMDRVINGKLKPILMKEILFGKLKHGGPITIGYDNGSLSIK